MLSFFTSGLKRTIPKKLWESYILAKGRWSELDVSGWLERFHLRG